MEASKKTTRDAIISLIAQDEITVQQLINLSFLKVVFVQFGWIKP